MTDLQKGLELVRQACELDHLNQHKEALPYYKNSLIFLKKALSSVLVDDNTKKILPEKIHLYENRVKELELIINGQPEMKLDLSKEEDLLIKQTMDGKTSNLVVNTTFSANNSTVFTSPEDRELQERFLKIKTQPIVPIVTDNELHDRLSKISGLKPISTQPNNVNNVDLFREETEDEQIQKILNQVQDDLSLDMVTTDKDKEMLKKKEKSKEDSNDLGPPPAPFVFPSSSSKSKNISKKKTKKKKKKRYSDSDSSNDSLSDSDSDDPDLEVKETDDELKRREKAYLKKMFEEEKAKKAVAYQQWKNNKNT